MTNPDELLRLAERVEQGSGEDDKLASDIFYALGKPQTTRYLTSLDAVETLRQRLLPGSAAACVERPDIWQATVWLTHYVIAPYFSGDAPTEARARLAALLRAVAGKEA